MGLPYWPNIGWVFGGLGSKPRPGRIELDVQKSTCFMCDLIRDGGGHTKITIHIHETHHSPQAKGIHHKNHVISAP